MQTFCCEEQNAAPKADPQVRVICEFRIRMNRSTRTMVAFQRGRGKTRSIWGKWSKFLDKEEFNRMHGNSERSWSNIRLRWDAPWRRSVEFRKSFEILCPHYDTFGFFGVHFYHSYESMWNFWMYFRFYIFKNSIYFFFLCVVTFCSVLLLSQLAWLSGNKHIIQLFLNFHLFFWNSSLTERCMEFNCLDIISLTSIPWCNGRI